MGRYPAAASALRRVNLREHDAEAPPAANTKKICRTFLTQLWGIEVKAAISLTPRDGQGLARLADRCGKDFQRGILLYAGRDIMSLVDKRMLAMPLNELWTR